MDVELINLDCTVCVTLVNLEGKSRLECGREYFYPKKRKYQTGEKYLLKIVETLRTPNIIRLIAPTNKSGCWEASNA
jgi:hypothetical protein